ncbi:MAG TPA: (p)ppGpp synthetase, partial [Eubacteriaceae bacterium]|nr:(p)ppGpp synthetase [Eubacteriaceae bacterium]
GIAAHWKYKEGVDKTDNFEEKLVWIRQILEWQRELQDANEFMETLKVDLLTDSVFVFTPKGDVFELPKGSCPLDFAYRIHSDIGNSCIGAKINGKMVPLNYTLQNGDIVEVITSSNSPGPSRDWLKIVKSSHARNKIKQFFKKDKKEENIQKGKDLLDREIKRQGLQNTSVLKHEYLEYAAQNSNYNTVIDLYAALGYGGIKANVVLQKIKTRYKNELNLTTEAEEKVQLEKYPEEKPKKTAEDYGKLEKAVKVSGFKNMAVRFSKCCNPVPGDPIIGYITRGRGVSVHRTDCVNIKNADDRGRLIEVEWVKYTNANFVAEINIEAKDARGLMTKVTTVISDQKTTIVSLNVRTSQDYAYINVSFEVKSTRELNQIIKQLKKIPEIVTIHRI